MGISEGFMYSFDYWKSSIIKFDPAWFSKHWVLVQNIEVGQHFPGSDTNVRHIELILEELMEVTSVQLISWG